MTWCLVGGRNSGAICGRQREFVNTFATPPNLGYAEVLTASQNEICVLMRWIRVTLVQGKGGKKRSDVRWRDCEKPEIG